MVSDRFEPALHTAKHSCRCVTNARTRAGMKRFEGRTALSGMCSPRQAAIDVHMTTPHFKDLPVKLEGVIAQAPDIVLYEEIASVHCAAKC